MRVCRCRRPWRAESGMILMRTVRWLGFRFFDGGRGEEGEERGEEGTDVGCGDGLLKESDVSVLRTNALIRWVGYRCYLLPALCLSLSTRLRFPVDGLVYFFLPFDVDAL